MDAPPGHRVFVGGISWKADEVQLANFFSTHGQVLECKIIMDKATGQSKGYGFVTFKDANVAELVKQTANFHFLGKNMNVGDAVRKASEPNGANHTPRSPHGNYNNGYHQPYHYNNYYNRQNDTQFYGQYSPDGTFYPAQYYYPQGYRGNPQYQYGQNTYPVNYPAGFSTEDQTTISSDSTVGSPPTYTPYAPYNPNSNPNYTPYYNNGNYYNAYYYPYSGGYPAYGYNQNFNNAQVEGGEEGNGEQNGGGGPANVETNQSQLQPDHHVNNTPSTTSTTDTTPTSTPSSTSAPTTSASGTQPPPSESTPAAAPPSSATPSAQTSDATTCSEPQQVTSSSSASASSPQRAMSPPQPTSQRSLPNKASYSNSPAQGRSQGGPRNSPKTQSQQKPQQNNKQKQQQKPTSPRPPAPDPTLHNHVIPSFSKLSVSSN